MSVNPDESSKTFSPKKSDNDWEWLLKRIQQLKTSLYGYETVQNHDETDECNTEKMREATESRGNVSWREENSQASPTLAFEAPTNESSKTFLPRKSDDDWKWFLKAIKRIKKSLYGYETVQNNDETDECNTERMREATESRGNVSWHEENSQASPTLAFEAPTSAKDLQDTDSNVINAFREDSEAEFSEDNITLDHDTGEIPEQVNTEPSDDRSSNGVTEVIDTHASDDFNSDGIGYENYSDSRDDHNIGSILEDINDETNHDHSSEDDSMNTLYLKKRKSGPIDESPPVKKKKDDAVQASVAERSMFSDFFVGTPLVYRLCRCRDHTCS